MQAGGSAGTRRRTRNVQHQHNVHHGEEVKGKVVVIGQLGAEWLVQANVGQRSQDAGHLACATQFALAWGQWPSSARRTCDAAGVQHHEQGVPQVGEAVECANTRICSRSGRGGIAHEVTWRRASGAATRVRTCAARGPRCSVRRTRNAAPPPATSWQGAQRAVSTRRVLPARPART